MPHSLGLVVLWLLSRPLVWLIDPWRCLACEHEKKRQWPWRRILRPIGRRRRGGDPGRSRRRLSGDL